VSVEASDLVKHSFKVLTKISTASNLALLLQSESESNPIKAIFKPILGVQPLWDFPNNDLIEREFATFILSEQANLDLVPPTAIRKIENFGTGMIQLWIEDAKVEIVKLFDSNSISEEYLPVLEGRDQADKPVTLAVKDSAWVDQLTIFDAVINNSDRKASHIITTSSGKSWAIDHGVSWHTENKLRSVLWGKAGQELTSEARSTLQHLEESLIEKNDVLSEFLTQQEIDAAFSRLAILKESGAFPVPNENWPAIPWPVF
jgi:uncharacterized repeat protein (TIGR03843 family)